MRFRTVLSSIIADQHQYDLLNSVLQGLTNSGKVRLTSYYFIFMILCVPDLSPITHPPAEPVRHDSAGDGPQQQAGVVGGRGHGRQEGLVAHKVKLSRDLVIIIFKSIVAIIMSTLMNYKILVIILW
jgi:hypothetical protein